MGKFSIFEEETHLGDIQADSEHEALQQVRKLYPGRPGLRVESASSMEHADPTSIMETKRAFDKILGRDGMYRQVYENRR